MSGIADVAKHAGVSKATASRALTGRGYVSAETRDKVLAAADELGYVASTSAVSLATGRTRNVGVIMPYVNRWFFSEVLEGIQASLLTHGLDLTLYDAKPDSPARRRIFDDFLARKRFDALIAVGIEPVNDELDQMLALARPMVSVVNGSDDVSCITLDDDDAIGRAVEHLVGLGHRDIVFLGGGISDHWAHVDGQRLEAYFSAMAAEGLAEVARHVPAVVSIPGGHAAAVDLLGSPRSRPEAVIGVCDEVAIGAMIAARRLGLDVPRDLSIVGVDGHDYAEMFALTTMQQRPREQGTSAVELVLSHLRDPELPPVHIVNRAQLIMRNSTAPPRSSHPAKPAEQPAG